VNFRLCPLAAAQRIRNLIFGGVRAEAVENLKTKRGKEHQKRSMEVSADKKGSLI